MIDQVFAERFSKCVINTLDRTLDRLTCVNQTVFATIPVSIEMLPVLEAGLFKTNPEIDHERVKYCGRDVVMLQKIRKAKR